MTHLLIIFINILLQLNIIRKNIAYLNLTKRTFNNIILLLENIISP